MSRVFAQFLLLSPLSQSVKHPQTSSPKVCHTFFFIFCYSNSCTIWYFNDLFWSTHCFSRIILYFEYDFFVAQLIIFSAFMCMNKDIKCDVTHALTSSPLCHKLIPSQTYFLLLLQRDILYGRPLTYLGLNILLIRNSHVNKEKRKGKN